MHTFSRRTFLSLLSAILFFLTTLPALHAAAPVERSGRVTLLQLNDLYDIMPVEKGKKGGLARIATLRDRIAKETPDALLVLAGDFLSPSTMSSVFQGSQMVAGLNAVGVDLVTFGNHEFDFGEQVTLQRMRESRFTWVSSNVLDPGTGLPFGDAVSFVLRDIGGIRVAFIGLTTPETHALSKGGKNLMAGDGYAGLSETAIYMIGGIIKHARAINAFTNPGTNSYKRLVPGYEAPVMLAYSAKNRSASIRIPAVANPKARRIEVRFPDPSANPYLGFAALLMAGLDGIQNKIHPGDALDKNLYDLPAEEAAQVPTVSHSLEMALAALNADRAFLTAGGVFDDDMIDAYIELKQEDIDRIRMSTHPVEFDMYYSC